MGCAHLLCCLRIFLCAFFHYRFCHLSTRKQVPMTETLIFVVAYLAVMLVFGVVSCLVRHAHVKVERAALMDLNAPLIASGDRRLEGALRFCRDVQEGYKVCAVCGFENFKRFRFCTLCGEALAEDGEGEEGQANDTIVKKKSASRSFWPSLFKRDNRTELSALSTLPATPKKVTRRQLRAMRRKEWSRKLDVEGHSYWFHDTQLVCGDKSYAGFVIRFTSSHAQSDAYDVSIKQNDSNIENSDTTQPVAESVLECIARLKRETQSVRADLIAASDANVDTLSLSMECAMGPSLPVSSDAVESKPLAETMILASKGFPVKHMHFVMMASALMVPAERRHMRLKIQRARVFEESTETLATIPLESLHSVLRINFIGESGVDAGGLHREWFVMLNEMLVDPLRDLFVCTNKNEQTYFLSPCSDSTLLSHHLLHLYAAGRLFGRALLEGSMLCFHLAPPLLKLIVGYPLSLSDLEDLDPEVYTNLRWLLANDNVDALGLDFTLTAQEGDKRQTIELVPNGSEISVTDSNKIEYVERRWKYLLVEGIAPQLYALIRGLYEVVPHELLLLFDPEEFDYLLCGSDDIDVDDWERNTQYSSSLYHHRARTLFWELVREMRNEYRRRSLQFSTGSSRVPLGGFSALTSYDGRLCPFSLKAVSLEGDGYIHSHACFNRLDLPLHFEREKMKAVLYAMLDEEVYGFTMD